MMKKLLIVTAALVLQGPHACSSLPFCRSTSMDLHRTSLRPDMTTRLPNLVRMPVPMPR
jgi:hypothetical protein